MGVESLWGTGDTGATGTSGITGANRTRRHDPDFVLELPDDDVQVLNDGTEETEETGDETGTSESVLLHMSTRREENLLYEGLRGFNAAALARTLLKNPAVASVRASRRAGSPGRRGYSWRRCRWR